MPLPVGAFIIFAVKWNNITNPEGVCGPITIANDTSGSGLNIPLINRLLLVYK